MAALLSLTCLIFGFVVLIDLAQAGAGARTTYAALACVLAGASAWYVRWRAHWHANTTEVLARPAHPAERDNPRPSAAPWILATAGAVALSLWAYAPERHMFRGIAAFERLDLPAAIEAYEQATQAPSLPRLRRTFAWVALGHARFEYWEEHVLGDEILLDALNAYEQADALSRERRTARGEEQRPTALMQDDTAWVYQALGAYDEAQLLLDEIFADDPHDENPYVIQAQLHRAQGQMEEALAVLDRYLERREDGDGYIQYQRGKTLYYLGRFYDAAAAHTAAISADDDYAWPYIYRACAQKHLNDFAGAVADYRRGIELLEEIFEGTVVTPARTAQKTLLAKELEALEKLESGETIDETATFCRNHESRRNRPRERSPLLPPAE